MHESQATYMCSHISYTLLFPRDGKKMTTECEYAFIDVVLLNGRESCIFYLDDFSVPQ